MTVEVILQLPAAGENLAPDPLLLLEVKRRIVQQFIEYLAADLLRGAGGRVPGQPVKNLHQGSMLLVDRVDARFEIPVPGEYFKCQIFAVVFYHPGCLVGGDYHMRRS
ncbi:hypothetical protein D9M68_645820 [compost metagenome]